MKLEATDNIMGELTHKSELLWGIEGKMLGSWEREMGTLVKGVVLELYS